MERCCGARNPGPSVKSDRSRIAHSRPSLRFGGCGNFRPWPWPGREAPSGLRLASAEMGAGPRSSPSASARRRRAGCCAFRAWRWCYAARRIHR